MNWWNSFVAWVSSDTGWRIMSTAIIPFVAIVVAGVIAAIIGRGTVRRLFLLRDQELRMAAVTALIGAARQAAQWNSLPLSEQNHAERLAHEADIAVRLLPLSGAGLAADWAAHQIDALRKEAVGFASRGDLSLAEVRDRLIEWQQRPSRAKKLFKADMELWAFEAQQESDSVSARQREWQAEQERAKSRVVDTETAFIPQPAALPSSSIGDQHPHTS